MQTPNGIVTKPSRYTVAGTLDRLEGMLLSGGVTVFARIDHALEAEKVGLAMAPTQLLVFGNPKTGTPLMVAEPIAAIDLPLKALAWQDANGYVWLSYNAPGYLALRFGLAPDLMEGLAGVETLIEQALA